ncbi:MAG: winged helix-turn-helix transcriptional regulator [Alcanivoracaceae bacterium]|nr:winged helix-turn-helix transcriptional regulator [Alcanivoracaceae bacterium]
MKNKLDHIFMALADQTRRDIVHRLAISELTVSKLAEGFDMSLNAISKHIKVLEKAKLVSRRIDGRIHYISLVPEQFSEPLDWISIYRNFWQNRLNLLSKIIDTNEE